jgi:hypothetical protein
MMGVNPSGKFCGRMNGSFIRAAASLSHGFQKKSVEIRRIRTIRGPISDDSFCDGFFEMNQGTLQGMSFHFVASLVFSRQNPADLKFILFPLEPDGVAVFQKAIAVSKNHGFFLQHQAMLFAAYITHFQYDLHI